MTTLTPDDLLPGSHHDIQPRVEPTDHHGITFSHSQTRPGSPDGPQRGDPAHTGEADMPAAANAATTPRTVPADPHVSLDPLAWLVVVLVAVLLTVLAHAASMRADQAQHHEPSLLTDPAYVLARKHPPPEPGTPP